MNSLVDINNNNNIFDDDDVKFVCDKFSNEVRHMFQEADKARDYYERMKDYRPIFIKNLLTKRREIRNRKLND